MQDDFGLVNDLTIYGNVLINNKLKLETLKRTLPQWVEYWDAPTIIRVRGKYWKEVFEFCAGLKSVVCLQGSDFIQWRKQTWWDISKIKTRFVMLYLEDHLLSSAPPNKILILQELKSKQVSVFQYSWFQQYGKLLNSLPQFGGEELDAGMYVSLKKNNFSKIIEHDFRWIISLTSVFDRNFLLTVLKSSRPYLRKKDPRSPHDVEQNPNSSWYLPTTFGLSKTEFGISIDDDNSIPGSSAISRGLYYGNRSERGANHEGRFSTIRIARLWKTQLFGNESIKFLPLKLKIFLTHLIFWPSYIGYSIQAPIFRLLDSYTAMRLRRIENVRSREIR